MNIKKKILIILIFLITTQNNAYAYLEPGTLSIIFQVIVAAIASTVAYVSFYFSKVKKFISKIFKRQKK